MQTTYITNNLSYLKNFLGKEVCQALFMRSKSILGQSNTMRITCLTSSLRLLQTFAGVLQKKIRMRAVLKETPQTIYQ